MNRSNNGVNNRASVAALRRVLLKAKLNLSVLIDSRRAQVRATKISSKDQFSFIQVFHQLPLRLSLRLCAFAPLREN